MAPGGRVIILSIDYRDITSSTHRDRSTEAREKRSAQHNSDNSYRRRFTSRFKKGQRQGNEERAACGGRGDWKSAKERTGSGRREEKVLCTNLSSIEVAQSTVPVNHLGRARR